MYELGWHFLPANRRLRFEPSTIVSPGKKLVIEGEIKLGERGFHASKRIIDALEYTTGVILCRVLLSGSIIHGEDKMVASERTVLWMADATDMLRHYACMQALSVAHLWDCPDVVRQWLRKESPQLKSITLTEAWNPPIDATCRPARDAAQIAIWGAAWGAAYQAVLGIACGEARSEAWSEAWSEANQQLERFAAMLCGPESAQFAPGYESLGYNQ